MKADTRHHMKKVYSALTLTLLGATAGAMLANMMPLLGMDPFLDYLCLVSSHIPLELFFSLQDSDPIKKQIPWSFWAFHSTSSLALVSWILKLYKLIYVKCHILLHAIKRILVS